ARHDLAGAGGGRIDEAHERVAGLGAGRRRALLFTTFGGADRRDYDAAIPPQIGDLRRLLEQAAGIAAQIEHDASNGPFVAHLVERLADLRRRGRLELLETHV